jgi:hypothetical protein
MHLLLGEKKHYPFKRPANRIKAPLSPIFSLNGSLSFDKLMALLGSDFEKRVFLLYHLDFTGTGVKHIPQTSVMSSD